MSTTLTVDMSQWRKAAQELYATSSRSLQDFTNGQALKVAVESIRNTRFVAPDRITYELGQVGQEVEIIKAKTKRAKRPYRIKRGGYLFGPGSLAVRILGKRFRETGSWGIKGKTIEEAAERLVKVRRSSTHFIRSGWIPARTRLWAVVKQKAPGTGRSAFGAKVYGKPKGNATPAIFTWSKPVFSEIQNSALMTSNKRNAGRTSNPMPIATEGLQKALQLAARDMIETLARRLKPDFRKVSAHG